MAKPEKDLIPRKRIMTWILVADGARARVLANEGPGKGLVDAFDRDFVGAHDLMRELVSDKPARGQESATSAGRAQDNTSSARHAVEAKTEWHRFEKQQFARRMADILERAAVANLYDRLVLVAPPQALGDLRSELGSHAQKRVMGEMDKDLTHVAIHDLPPHLSDVIRL
jgi:protein required for attachment to host cells